MKEASFTTEVMRSLKHYNLWAYKIPDTPINKKIMELMRFTPEKPCDIVACYQGLMVAVETKQFKKWQAFGLRHMEPAQIDHLTRIVKEKGRAFVFLNVRIKAPHVNRLFIFDWATLYPRLKKASIKAVELKERAYEGYFKNDKDKLIYDLEEWLLLL